MSAQGFVKAIPQIIAVDTLGAGDVWHGAFCLQLARGADENSAVRFANVAAALKCTRSGGGYAAPELDTVTDYLTSLEKRQHYKKHPSAGR
jgi:sugar/nucleoside kinase (ribokinase family)